MILLGRPCHFCGKPVNEAFPWWSKNPEKNDDAEPIHSECMWSDENPTLEADAMIDSDGFLITNSGNRILIAGLPCRIIGDEPDDMGPPWIIRCPMCQKGDKSVALESKDGRVDCSLHGRFDMVLHSPEELADLKGVKLRD